MKYCQFWSQNKQAINDDLKYNSSMKKIAFYLSGIGTGGIESVTISQYLYMDRSNVEVEFVVDSPPSNNFNVERINKAGGTIRTCFKDNKPSIIRKIQRPFALVRTVRKRHYDIVHFRFSHPSSLVYVLLCRLFSHAKLVVTSESQGAANMPLLSKFICLVCSRLLPKLCDVRLADSRPAGRWMFGDNSFYVIADGFDTLEKKYTLYKRNEIRNKLGILSNEKLIGHIGRFAPEKNQTFLVDVFEEYLKLHPNTKLLLLGKGTLRDSIISKCKNKNIHSKCIFIESVDNLDAYYSAMDIFIFPSICEGFGMVAAEAQAASLPVLASSTVPNETKLTDIFMFEDLSAPLSKWVEDIDTLIDLGENRECVDLSILYKKCDVCNISNELIQIYNNL